MNKLRYYFSSKKRQMAKLHDLSRQLAEAWDEHGAMSETLRESHKGFLFVVDRLHAVARERDECYRQKRLDDIRRKKEE
jgi:hypothetical protein